HQLAEASAARKYSLLHHGVQILITEDDDYRAAWPRTTKHLTYEEKLGLRGDCKLLGPDGFPVTSLCNRAQGIAYTDRI
ncbi:hypothetical protein RA277_31075, partial [Pseudomonas syringae pv. tagetis]